MSTEFTTEPRLTYDQVLASERLTAETCEPPVYAGRRHARLRSKAGTPAGSILLFEDEGHARFERFMGNNAELLLLVAEEHNVRVFDEHGLHYPEESDG